MALNGEPKIGFWDFDGNCKPTNNCGWITFSVGIFQWLPKSGGKGLKRGKVKERLRGLSRDADELYNRAKARCRELNKE